jgi:hypothetical protein
MIDKVIILVKNYKTYGLPLVAIFIGLLITALVIFPQLIGYFSVQKNIYNIESQASTLNNKALTLSAVNTKDYQGNLNVVLNVLPAEKDLPSTIGQVESLVAASSLQLQGINFVGAIGDSSNNSSSDSSPTNNLSTFLVKLDMDGTQNALQTFIQQVKAAPQVFQISGLEVDTNKSGAITATVTLTAYYGGLSNSLSASDQPAQQLTKQETDLLSRLQDEVGTNPFNSSDGTLPPRGKPNPFQ